MKIKNKLVLLTSLMMMTSCGYAFNNAIDYKIDHSSVFQDNFYRIWDKRLGTDHLENKTEVIDIVSSSITYWEKYNDDKFKIIDVDAASMQFNSGGRNKSDTDSIKYFENHRKLSLYDSTFKNGFISKLFDGQVDCYGYYQQARIQIDETGFGYLFKKELSSFTCNEENKYIAFSVKPVIHSIEGNEYYSENTTGKMNLKIGLIFKNKGQFNRLQFIFPLEYRVNSIQFIGFSLKGYDLTRLNGISIEYENTENEYLNEHSDYDAYLFLYEMILQYIDWH